MRKIGVLMATAFVDMLGSAIVFPLMPFYALRLHAEPWMIGWIIAMFPLAQLASAPLWGRFSDRYGRRPALLVGLAASAAAFLVFALAGRLWLLFLSRLVQGLGGGTTGVAQAYIGDSVAPAERAKALGWLSAATSAGVMVGPALGSLCSTLGPAAPGVLAATLCLVNLWCAFRWLPEPSGARPAPDAARGERRPIRHALLDVLRHPFADVPLLVWLYAAGMLGFMSMTAVLPLFLRERFGTTERTIGLFFVYTGAIGLVMRGLLLGPLVERLGEVRLLRLGGLALALGLALLPLPARLLPAAAVMALVPVGTACLFPATSALVSRRAVAAELGQTLGVQQAFGGAARVLAPIAATAVFQRFGRDAPFRAAALVVAVVIALGLRVRQEARPRAAPADASAPGSEPGGG